MPDGSVRLQRSDYAIDPVALAKHLLGCTLVRLHRGRRLAGVIVETEAYCGPEDKAAHSVGWRRTPRTEPMFGPPGTSYVFLTYGMHHCFNVVCGAVDEPVAVLVRALAPSEGLTTMRRLRARPASPNARPRDPAALRETDLCSGPAKLCAALGIDRTHNALSLVESPVLWIEPPATGWSADQIAGRIINTTRIGVDYAQEWADAPLRWYDADSPHVSVRDRVREAQGKPPARRPRTE